MEKVLIRHFQVEVELQGRAEAEMQKPRFDT
jgi:hypothetical protein